MKTFQRIINEIDTTINKLFSIKKRRTTQHQNIELSVSLAVLSLPRKYEHREENAVWNKSSARPVISFEVFVIEKEGNTS